MIAFWPKCSKKLVFNEFTFSYYMGKTKIVNEVHQLKIDPIK